MSCSARGVWSVCAGVPGNLQGACVGKEKDRACTYTCLHPFALSSFRPFHPLIPSFLSPCIAHPFACSPCLRPFPLPTLSAPCCVSLGEGEERTSHGAEHGTREGAGRGQAGIPSPPAALHPFAPSPCTPSTPNAEPMRQLQCALSALLHYTRASGCCHSCPKITAPPRISMHAHPAHTAPLASPISKNLLQTTPPHPQTYYVRTQQAPQPTAISHTRHAHAPPSSCMLSQEKA